MANKSRVMEFLLIGFSADHDVQSLYFVMLLFIYLGGLTDNLLIIFVLALNYHLHTPMYFFLINLSLTDICYITTTVPKSMAVSLKVNKIITFPGCVVQVFLIITCASSEVSLLTIMAFDRYVAICHPLQYSLILNWNTCHQMAVASWVISLLYALLQTVITFQLNFCGPNMIGQFFCDIPQLLKISCTDTTVNQILIWIFALIVNSFIIGFIFASKAFSACSPHLTVFSLFMSTALFSYMRPKSLSSPTMDLLSAISYTVLPPVLNPIIYSLWNKDIQAAVWKIMRCPFAF